MNTPNDKAAGNGAAKTPYQTQNLGPNKIAAEATAPVTKPVVPEVVHQVTPKPAVTEPAAPIPAKDAAITPPPAVKADGPKPQLQKNA